MIMYGSTRSCCWWWIGAVASGPVAHRRLFRRGGNGIPRHGHGGGALTTWFRNNSGEDLVAGGGDAYEGLAAEAGHRRWARAGRRPPLLLRGANARYSTLGPWVIAGCRLAHYARGVYRSLLKASRTGFVTTSS